MSRLYSIAGIVAFILLLPSCVKDYIVVANEEYESIYRVEDFIVSGSGSCLTILPEVSSYDAGFDEESKAFYSSLDSSLSYSGKVHYQAFSGGYHKVLSAVDWRINTVDIISREDFDEQHPAGSSLCDLIEIRYHYKHSLINRPLSDIHYGVMMITDYFPYGGYDYAFLKLCLYQTPFTNYREIQECEKITAPLSYGEAPFPAIEIRITDAFGREFVKQYDPKIEQSTL